MSGMDLIKYMTKKKGFRPLRIKGSHCFLTSSLIPMLPVPLYKKMDRSLLGDILTEAKIDKDEFIKDF